MNNIFSFSDCWLRIQNSSNINNLTELANLIDISQPTISRNKKNDSFPEHWAIVVGYKLNIHPEWIMTGEGQKQRSQSNSTYHNKLLHEIDRWLTELIKNEPFRREWFLGVFLDSFPKFAKWRTNQNSVKNEYHTPKNSKAA